MAADCALSAVLLYRAHAAARLLGSSARRSRRARAARARYRTRVSVAAGAIGLLLVSLPFVPAVAGVGGEHRPLRVPAAASRRRSPASSSTPRGPVKLFAWQDPQSPYPATRFASTPPTSARSSSRAAAVDGPGAYGLFDLDRARGSRSRALRRRGASSRSRRGRRLRPGRYMFVATHEGMFGGRDFVYLTVVRAGRAGDADQLVRERPRARGRGLAAARRGGARRLAVRLPPARSYWRGRPARRRSGQPALPALRGRDRLRGGRAARRVEPGALPHVLPRGGVLTVACLGAGSAWLLLRAAGATSCSARSRVGTRRGGRRLARARRRAALAATASGRPPATARSAGMPSCGRSRSTRSGPLSSSAGRCTRSRGAVASARTSGSPRGALVVALATGLSRGGDYSLVYLGQLVGIAPDVLRLHVRRAQDRAAAGTRIRAPPPKAGSRAMTIDAEALRTDAAEISRERITRTRRRLRALSARSSRSSRRRPRRSARPSPFACSKALRPTRALAAVLAELYPVGNGPAPG